MFPFLPVHVVQLAHEWNGMGARMVSVNGINSMAFVWLKKGMEG
jgi:hypothetical protein